MFELLSCTADPDQQLIDREKILELHHPQRAFHFNKDSIAFANLLSKDFISVNKGEIDTPTREENLSRFNPYFSSVEFIKWDDVTAPVIRFSDDHTMTYTVVDKIVLVKSKDESGNIVTRERHFAWTAIDRKLTNE